MIKKIGKIMILMSEIDNSITIGKSKCFYMNISPKSSWYLLPTIEVCRRYVGIHFLCFFLRTD